MAKPKKVINAPVDGDAKKVELVAPEGTFATIEIEGKKCFLKKPSKQTYSKVLPMLSSATGGEPDMIGAGEIILRECNIGGDTEFMIDDDFVIPAALQCLELFEMKQATLKKS